MVQTIGINMLYVWWVVTSADIEDSRMSDDSIASYPSD